MAFATGGRGLCIRCRCILHILSAGNARRLPPALAQAIVVDMYRSGGFGQPSSAQRRATGFTVGGMSLLLVARLSDNVTSGMSREVPFTMALFVIPLLYAFA